MSSDLHSSASPSIATEGELPIRRFSSRASSAFGLEKIWVEGAAVKPLPKGEMALQLAQLAWKSFSASPVTAFLTLLTISVVLFIFGGFILLLQNISVGVSGGSSEVSLRLFLFDAVSDQDKESLRAEIGNTQGVQSARVISKQGALEEFRTALGGDAALLDGLDANNPLPASVEVRFQPGEGIASAMQSFAERYRSNPMVQEVQYSQSLVGQLSELIRLVRVVGVFAIVLMLAVTAFVIATTIRLALYSHRQELQIMRLVGARAWFIKTPFLIEGMAEGFLGAVAGLLLLWLGHGALMQALSGSELARAFQIEIGFLAAHWIFLIVLLGPLLGLIGSYLAVRRFAEE